MKYQYTDHNHTIVTGDCLEFMKALPDDSVNLVLCSPPYEDARTYGIGFNLKGDEWVQWAKERFVECCRVSKGLVAWVIEGKTKNFRWSATPALLMAELHRAGISLRKPPIYHRVGIPGSGGPDWLRNDYEFIVCASKGKLPWSDNTACGHEPKYGPGGPPSHRLLNGERVSGPSCKEMLRSHGVTVGGRRSREKDGKRTYSVYVPPEKANPGNVIHCKAGGGHLGSNLAHENEAPFPESLAEFFVKSFCPPGGIVLDIFGGSGTTLSAAHGADRICWSVDIRESQSELTYRRYLEAEEKKNGKEAMQAKTEGPQVLSTVTGTDPESLRGDPVHMERGDGEGATSATCPPNRNIDYSSASTGDGDFQLI